MFTSSTALLMLISGQPSKISNHNAIFAPPSLITVQEIPDITGDGINDLLVGYPAQNSGNGIIYIFEGPLSSSGGFLPAPALAIGEIQPIEGVENFGNRIRLLSFANGTEAPAVLVGAKVTIDGVTSRTAIFIELLDTPTDIEYVWFRDHIEVSEFDTLAGIETIRLQLDNADGGAGGPSPITSQTIGPYKGWEHEVPGYKSILENASYGGVSNLLKFESATYSAHSNARFASKRLGWDTGQRNAFRHSLWMAKLTNLFGGDTAIELGDHHETFSEDEIASAVDNYNNEVGRQLMQDCLAEGKDLEDAQNKLLEMVNSRDEMLIYSEGDPRIPDIIDGTIDLGTIIFDFD